MTMNDAELIEAVRAFAVKETETYDASRPRSEREDEARAFGRSDFADDVVELIDKLRG